MRLNWLPVLLGSVALQLPLTVAQSIVTEAEAALPACALSCLATSLSFKICSVDDLKCICTSQSFNVLTNDCVASNCTIREGLTTEKFINSACGAPVRNRTKAVSYVGVAGGILAAIAVVFRLLARLPCFGGNFGMDDAVIIISTMVMIPLTVLSVILANAGLGKDIWEVSFDDITRVLKIYYFDEMIYIACIALTKVSILFFYLRIFPDRKFRYQVYGVMAMCIAFMISFIVPLIFQCKPINLAWNRWDGEHSGKCINANAIGWAASGLNIALDIMTIALPLPQIANLNLSKKRKLPLLFVFGLGFFVTVISMIRIKYMAQFADAQNVTWDYVPIGYWSTIEVHLGIIIACLPALRALFIQVFPAAARLENTNKNIYSSNASKTTTGRSTAAIRISQKVDHFVELKDMDSESRTQSRGNATNIYSPYGGRQPPPPVPRAEDPFKEPRVTRGFKPYSEDWS